MRLINLVVLSSWGYYGGADMWYVNRWWKSRLISVDGDSASRQELFYGSTTFSPITIKLDNSDGHFTDLYHSDDIRGDNVILRYYDMDAGVMVGSAQYYVCNNIKISRSECTVTATPFAVDAFDIELPKATIQSSIFGSTIDDSVEGKPIPIPFGYCEKAPIYSIYEGTDYFSGTYSHIFLIGYGTIDATTASVSIYSSGRLCDVSEYTVYDGSQESPFPGYAIVAFNREQRDSNYNLYDMRMTYQGISYSGSTNPVRILQTVLTDTTWGLGKTVDETSFATAAAMFENYAWWVCGGIFDFTRASDFIDQLLASCKYAFLSIGASGTYTITVPAFIGTSSATFDQYNMKDATLKNSDADQYVKDVVVRYAHRLEDDSWAEKTAATGSSFGIQKSFDVPFLYYATPAQELATYLKNCFLYRDNILEFETGNSAISLAVGNIITVTYPELDIDGETFEIIEIEKSVEGVRIKAASYSNDIFRQT